ncbi:MAG: toxin-antitoxin system YwqK family antitoxin, partial [Bacteroidota bacterium]
EGNYVNGQMEGKWKSFYNNGQLKEVVTFIGSQENGPFIEYYENGNLKAEGNYKDGDHEHGLLVLYKEDGTIERKMNCVNGRCSTTWSSEEKKE